MKRQLQSMQRTSVSRPANVRVDNKVTKIAKTSTKTKMSSATATATASASSLAVKSSSSVLLRFDDGAVQFRQRIAVSLLSHRSILIRNIRSGDADWNAPGLRPYEVSFLRLIDRITAGSRIEINNTGTQLRFCPGVLLGGEIEHACPVVTEPPQQHPDQDLNKKDESTKNKSLSSHLMSDLSLLSSSARSIGWFLEGILPLAPFGKEPLALVLTGITDGMNELDPSVDYWRAVIMPVLMQFGIAPGKDSGSSSLQKADLLSPQAPSLKIVQRGAAPAGGGKVLFYCPQIQQLHPIDWTDPGKFKRVRGSAVSCKMVSSSMAARVAYSAKGLLHRLLPDVWIHTDVHTVKQQHCGPSPSLSLILSAESTTGVVMTGECTWKHSQSHRQRSSLPSSNSLVQNRELPEDLGVRGAALLLEEIRRGGCVDSTLQSITLLWMCLTPEDVSRIRLGTITAYTAESLRLFQQAFGVEFKVRADIENQTVLLSCLGTGYRNMARAST